MRDLYKLLGYTEYGKFIPAIERAKEACQKSSQSVTDHFAGVSEMIKIATGTEKETLAILDHMGSEELAANLFRATQAEAKLKRENILGQDKANRAHHEVGKKVRKTIQELGGTMPEKLPTPEHVKESKKRLKKDQKVIKNVMGEGIENNV